MYLNITPENSKWYSLNKETNNIKKIEFAEVPTETGEISPLIIVIL